MLGSVLGRCLSTLGTLNAAYLPDGIGDETAESIVRRVNELRPASPPFALLVSEDVEDDSDELCPKISAKNAIKYRQGDRLAVVVGKHPDVASFVQAFKEVLGQNFPEGSTQEVSLRSVANAAIAEIAELTDIEGFDSWNPTAAEDRLLSCLELLSSIHRDLRQGTASWNAYWFDHVDRGLTNLVRKINDKKQSDPSLSIDEAFERYTYAAFVMPLPRAGARSKYSSKAYVEALQTNWSDESTISASAKLVGHSEGQGVVHPMELVNWSGFDRQLAALDNQCLAFVTYQSQGIDVVEAISQLTEEQFVRPSGNNANKKYLALFNSDSQPMSVDSEGAGGSVHVALATLSPDSSSELSEEIRVEIPTVGEVSADDVDVSSANIVSRMAKTQWDGYLDLDDDGTLWAVGRIRRTVGKQSSNAIQRPVRLEPSIEKGDALFGRLVPGVFADVFLVPMEVPGTLFYPMKARGIVGKPKYVGPESSYLDGSDEDDNGPFSGSLDGGARGYGYIAWTGNETQTPMYEGAVMDALNERDGLYTVRASPANLAIILIGERIFEFRAPENTTPCHSPIVAAVNKERVTRDRPGSETLESLRGLYESQLAENVRDTEWLRALGHVAAPVDREVPFSELRGHGNGAILMSKDMDGVWSAVSDIEVRSDFIDSSEAEEFRSAFSALDLSSTLVMKSSEGSEFLEIPSKTSWRFLWESREKDLARYLTAYADLVEKAKLDGDPTAIFWATYPFSISMWSTESSARSLAVLLSPLHPIRLAWLAGVESTLWGSEWARHLAGTVEGWNLPLIGPRETSSGRMLAVPVESGEDQIFLGWSMLVEASIDGPRPLESPERVGTLAAPGTAASGLNATAVAAALRSYRQMNPHVSTMTVDLSAVTDTTRLHEVDEAVLTAVETWTSKTGSSLIGGARIFDSVKRSGEPPREKMARLVHSTEGIPLTWSRYMPDSTKMKKCNVRILQDAGVHVEVKSGGSSNLGVIGNVPLRRFEAVSAVLGTNSQSFSSPTFRPDVGWDPMSRALRTFEGSAATPLIASKLFKANLVNDSADWTVSGEALMTPSAMANIVQHSSDGAQMLWEWRPPFLESSKDVPALERRPFVSVARVPHSFREQIRKLLTKAQGDEASDKVVNDLLGKLGARGVGLSALLSMGGTHASGALGFYLVFALMDLLQEESDKIFVLPIDACDTFLKALAGGDEHAGQTRRADILILRLDDGRLTLSPVEIKFYGLDAQDPHGNLPGMYDAAIAEPLEQVRTTHQLLCKVSDQWREIRDEGSDADSTLWTNGLAALVEAAIRLRPAGSREPEALARRLDALVNGQIDIEAGQPIICYFKHDSMTNTGLPFFASHTDLAAGSDLQREFGLLAANAGHTFTSIEALDKSTIGAAWRDLVTWALSNPVSVIREVAQTEGTGIQGERSIPPVELTEGEQEETHKPELELTDVRIQERLGGDELPEEGEPAVGEPTGTKIPNSSGGIRGDGVRFPVGNVLGTLGKLEAEFWPSNTELNQMNVGVVGDLGTGKTQLLKALVYQLRNGARHNQETPISMLIFDYKRDFQSENFLNAIGGVVLRPYRIPINIFALREGYSPLAAYQRAQQFADVLDKIYGNIGPLQTDRLVTSIVNLYKSKEGKPPTLSEVLDAYSEGQKPDAVTSILRPFILGEVFSDEPNEMTSFEDLMSDRVVVVALNDFGTDDNGKNSLVVLFLNLYYDYMLNATKWDFVGQSPQLRRLNSFLLVDEAVNIIKYNFPVLMNLMLQGREFGFGVILASQYLDHFKKDGQNYGQPLLTWFIHKVPSVSVKELQQLGLPNVSSDVATRIPQQKVHQALYSSLDVQGKFIEEVPFYRLLAE